MRDTETQTVLEQVPKSLPSWIGSRLLITHPRAQWPPCPQVLLASCRLPLLSLRFTVLQRPNGHKARDAKPQLLRLRTGVNSKCCSVQSPRHVTHWPPCWAPAKPPPPPPAETLTRPHKAGVEKRLPLWSRSPFKTFGTQVCWCGDITGPLPCPRVKDTKSPFSYENVFVHVGGFNLFVFGEGKACCLGHPCLSAPAAVSTANNCWGEDQRVPALRFPAGSQGTRWRLCSACHRRPPPPGCPPRSSETWRGVPGAQAEGRKCPRLLCPPPSRWPPCRTWSDGTAPPPEQTPPVSAPSGTHRQCIDERRVSHHTCRWENDPEPPCQVRNLRARRDVSVL